MKDGVLDTIMPLRPCTRLIDDPDMGEQDLKSSKVVKNPFSRFSGAPAAAACVQRDGYNGLLGCCSKGDDLVAALGAVRAEEGRLGASRITSCGYFLQKRQIPTTPLPFLLGGGNRPV